VIVSSNCCSRWSSVPENRASALLKRCVYSCLGECDRFKMTSVAVPAISCGIFGGKAAACAQLITQSIVKYVESQPTSIKEVCTIRISTAWACCKNYCTCPLSDQNTHSTHIHVYVLCVALLLLI